MLRYPDIDPVIVRLGPLAIRWYGLMYVLGFLCAWLLLRRRLTRPENSWFAPHFEECNTVLLLALLAGGRLGYVLFYNLPWYLAHPADIVAVWHGGMSFHGALMGVLGAGFWFCRHRDLPFLAVADLYVLPVPIGLGLGRIANFINGELYGRVTDLPWGMVFPGGGPLPRHPSQLYEALVEGVVLFFLLWWCRDRVRRPGGLLALFLGGYGVARFFLEFCRQPDPQIGFVLGPLTMGQVLSTFMVVAALGLWRWSAVYLTKTRKKVSKG